ncbi:hypothetical protein BU16DRAFT_619139 [Lophium mytilinum]|uniref:GIY-YIG domain-containing protein n=1 Tax=Lophium mytilinum TaxID=390894 RepID=A0A6A6QN67_9PEZI|nr:hypothetical protein BU16DRAFT_619139 [Lophium mytilinum]
MAPTVLDQHTFAGDTAFWEQVRDGFIPTLPGNTGPIRAGYGYKAIRFWKNEKDGVVIFPETTQGQIIELGKDSRYVKVHLPDLGKNGWVPRDRIVCGTVPWGNWKIKADLVTPGTIKVPRVPGMPSTSSRVYKAISTFLATLAVSRTSLLFEKFYELVGTNGEKIASLTNLVVEGIKKASLFDVLNTPDFTVKDLVDNSRYPDASKAPTTIAGIYFRAIKDANDEDHFYIGHTNNLPSRAQGYKTDTNNPKGKGYHMDLSAKAKKIAMCALCILPQDVDTGIRYLVEQIFVCLFETYRPTLFRISAGYISARLLADDPGRIVQFQYAVYLTRIAEIAAADSGWKGAVTRPGFGATQGVNWLSPLYEMTTGQTHERVLFIRSDGTVQDPTSKELIPVANFRRANARSTNWHAASSATTSNSQVFIISEIGDTKISNPHTTEANAAASSSGTDWPIQNQPFHVVYEVRKDWKLHPYPWARVPSIGPFMDWERANSLGVRLEWQDAKKQWRRRYLQVGSKSHHALDDKSPGSLKAYSDGMTIIHFLFREDRNDHRGWVTDAGFARVKRVRMDCISQTIQFLDLTDVLKPAVSIQRKPASIIKQQMEDDSLELEHVGGVVGGMDEGGRTYKRTLCDTCVLFGKRGSQKGCNQAEGTNSKVCSLCYFTYGRPFCSFTAGVMRQSSLHKTPALEAINRKRVSALTQLEWEVDAELGGDPDLQKLEIEVEELEEYDAAIAEALAEAEREEEAVEEAGIYENPITGA